MMPCILAHIREWFKYLLFRGGDAAHVRISTLITKFDSIGTDLSPSRDEKINPFAKHINDPRDAKITGSFENQSGENTYE